MTEKYACMNKFLSYKDSRYFTLKNLFNILKRKKQAIEGDEKFQHTTVDILTTCVDKIKKKQRLFGVTIENKKILMLISKIWSYFIVMPLSESTCTLILKNMDEKIYPYVQKRAILGGFLLNAFNSGKYWGLMSLVNLMLVSNIECPKLYENLYTGLMNILTDGCEDDNKIKFFLVLEKVMKSTHIPTYVVASFIKLLARKCLLSSLPDVLYMLNLIGILISFHVSARFLLTGQATRSEYDPFDPKNPDFTSNNVMKSYLWEFHVLQKHHNYYVRNTVKSLFEDTENAWKWRLTFMKLPKSLDDVSYINLANKLAKDDVNPSYDIKILSKPVFTRSEFVSFE